MSSNTDALDWMNGWAGHSLSLGALVGVFSGFVPAVAALASLAWFVIQIYESRTYQHWLRNRQMVSRAKKLARLRAQEKVTLAEIAAIERIRHARNEAIDIVAEARAEAASLLISQKVDTAENLPPI